MEYLRAARVTTLADLADPDRLTLLGSLLEKAFGRVLFAAVRVPADASAAAKGLLRAGATSRYWQDLRARPASFQKNRQRYRYLTARYVPDPLALAAATGLADEWQRLLRAAPVIPDLTALPTAAPIPDLPDLAAAPPTVAYPGFNRLGIGVEMGVVAGTTRPVVRTCQTCGRDISSQAASSRFCSERLYGNRAKSCRNAASNPGHNARRDVGRRLTEPALFDQVPYFRPPTTAWAFALGKLAGG